MSDIEYKIEKQDGVDMSGGLDFDDWKTIPVWHVFRVGKYTDEKAAQAALAEYEY